MRVGQGNQVSGAGIETRLTNLILTEDVHGLLSFFMANNPVLEATFAPGSPFGGLGPLHVAAVEGRAKVCVTFCLFPCDVRTYAC
jgi:hypothetical protein